MCLPLFARARFCAADSQVAKIGGIGGIVLLHTDDVNHSANFGPLTTAWIVRLLRSTVQDQDPELAVYMKIFV